MTYRNIFILNDATYVVKETRKAERPEDLFPDRPKGTRFIARYFPKSGKWRVYDANGFRKAVFGRRESYQAGAYFVAPEEAAAVMLALMHL